MDSLPIPKLFGSIFKKSNLGRDFALGSAKVPVKIQWEAPTELCIKSNSDASWDWKQKKWTAAAIVRGEDGNFRAATALPLIGKGVKCSDKDVEYAELMGLYIGVLLVPEKDHLWIETDNVLNAKCLKLALEGMSYFHLTKNLRQKRSWKPWKSVIRKLKKELRGKKVIVTHVYREANTAADMLSRTSKKCKGQITYRSNDPNGTPLPLHVARRIEEDMKGRSAVRRIKHGQGSERVPI